MNKLRRFICATAIGSLLCGCAAEQTDKDVLSVSDEIIQLSVHSVISEDDIEKIRSHYSALSDTQKEQVRNYDELDKMEMIVQSQNTVHIDEDAYRAVRYFDTDFKKLSEVTGRKNHLEIFYDNMIVFEFSSPKDAVKAYEMYAAYLDGFSKEMTDGEYVYTDEHGNSIRCYTQSADVRIIFL